MPLSREAERVFYSQTQEGAAMGPLVIVLG